MRVTDRLKTISFGSMALLMLVLVAATFIEKQEGTLFTTCNIYHSWWFIALWALLAVSAMAYIIHVSRRKALVLLHMSLVLILAGALISFMTSQRGEITLSKDAVPASMFTTADDRLEKLPFRLQLEKVDTCHTEETGEVSGYTAHITISDKEGNENMHMVSLNRPARIKGYSLCIKEIHDGQASFLVAYDPWGVTVSYTGYLLTIVSFIMLFFDRKSGLNTLLAKTRYCVTYKWIPVSIAVTLLVLLRIDAFTGDDTPPILRTPLLIAHISTIIAAYTLIGCAALNSAIGLALGGEKMEKAVIRGKQLLYPATLLLMTGIFVGAVWANISWGRYWGWDPKEVWALITLLTCSILFHTRSLPFMGKAVNFHIFCLVAFLTMLFTYFGVNYLFGGLHSYA